MWLVSTTSDVSFIFLCLSFTLHLFCLVLLVSLGQSITISSLSIIQASYACIVCVMNVLTTSLYLRTSPCINSASEKERQLPGLMVECGELEIGARQTPEFSH